MNALHSSIPERHISVCFGPPSAEHLAWLEEAQCAVNAFAALSPQEQQAQIATWPLEDQQLAAQYLPQAMPKAA